MMPLLCKKLKNGVFPNNEFNERVNINSKLIFELNYLRTINFHSKYSCKWELVKVIKLKTILVN